MYGTFAKPARGPVYMESPAHNPAVKWPTYDPELAKQLLAEANWKPVEVRILCGAGQFLKSRELCETLQQALVKVEIPVRIVELEYATFVREALQKRHEIILFTIGPRSLDPALTALDIAMHTRGRLNVSGYSNLALDKVLEQAKSIGDMEQRRKLYYQAQEMVVKDYVCISTHNEVDFTAYRREVKGYQHSTIGYNNLFDRVWLER